jgi:hypothetical protein
VVDEDRDEVGEVVEALVEFGVGQPRAELLLVAEKS